MPVSYTPKSLANLREHVKLHFGDAEYYMQVFLDNGSSVEIDVVRPGAYRNFYTFVTLGLGACANVLAGGARCELTFYLPSSWAADGPEWLVGGKNWPVELLKAFVQKAVADGVGQRSIICNGAPFAPNTRQDHAVLVEQVEDAMRRCYLESGEQVEFLSIFPLYAEEAVFFSQNGPEALMQAIEDDMEIIQVAPLCLDRKNVFDPNNKKFWLTNEKQILTEWNDGPYCWASDSIMVEGKPIGFCYRVEPDETDTLGWDSGWRFFAADDDELYRANPKNMGNFELNSLCNVDGCILPLLHAPFGSAYRRGADGRFALEIGTVPAPVQPSLLNAEAREFLKKYEGGEAADYPALIRYLREFVFAQSEKGAFTFEEARSNLELSLWYAYGSINCDSYEQSFEALQLMPDAENYALGCGCWFYRYACALTHCGRLKEAQRYAERGVEQEPSYPWNYLKLGRIYAHFGRTDEAMDMVREGLALVPGNYEFLTLQREINNGATIEQMEYHVIDPEADQRLQDGSLPGCEAKKFLTAGLVCDLQALEKVKAIFSPMTEWMADSPYCTFNWEVMPEEPLVVGFGMNEAALSKMDLNWLWNVRERLDGNKYRRQLGNDGEETKLVTVMIGWNKTVDLIYQYPEANKLLRVRMKM